MNKNTNSAANICNQTISGEVCIPCLMTDRKVWLKCVTQQTKFIYTKDGKKAVGKPSAHHYGIDTWDGL